MYVTIAKVALALLNFYEIVWQAIQLGLFNPLRPKLSVIVRGSAPEVGKLG